MAAPNRRSIDEEFNQDNYNQNSWGVQSAQLNKMKTGVGPGNAANSNSRPQAKFQNNALNQYFETGNAANDNQTLTSRPSEDGRRGRTAPRRYRGPQESNDFVDKVSRREQMVDERYYVDPREQMQQAANSNYAPTTKKKVRTSTLARARGITFGIVTISWLVPIYFFWQVPMSIIGAITLGLSFQIESSYLSSVTDLLPSFSLFGYDFNTLAGLGMLAIISSAVIGVVSSCVAAFTGVLAGLHPLSGNEAGSKHTKFLVGVAGGCIPFLNMFPWIIFWILVMMRHPK